MRRTADRIRHTLLFELTGLAVCTPLASWILNRGFGQIGALSLVLSLMAMGYNYLFNLLFDMALVRLGRPVHVRPPQMRVLHAVLFEAILMILTVPIVAWWLDMNLWEAVLTDLGFVLFFLVHAYAFNWTYDRVFPMPVEEDSSPRGP